MDLTISEVAEFCGARLLGNGSQSDLRIHHAVVDSRQLHHAQRSAFFALRGARRDGHDFIDSLYGSGVRCFIVSKQTISWQSYPEGHFMLVPDALRALQKLATSWRARFKIPIISITGSNGKTIVKEWLGHLLESEMTVSRSPKSYNSQIGVPLSVLGLQDTSELAIFEAGISRPGEMEFLQTIIDPDIGLFTNIGSAHQSGFSSLEEKIREKARLFSHCAAIICCRDHHSIYKHLTELGRPIVCWSRHDEDADLFIEEVRQGERCTKIIYGYRDAQGSIEIPFEDASSVENAIHCLCLLLHLKMGKPEIVQRFGTLQRMRMRLQTIAGLNNCTIIDDGYNADIESLRVAMSLAVRFPLLSKTLIISDFEQITGIDALHREIAKLTTAHGFSQVIGIGKESASLIKVLPEWVRGHHFPTTKTFIEDLPSFGFRDEFILLKGARSFGFEEISMRLNLQSHGAVLEVDLAAMARNIKWFEQFFEPATKVMVMVKAAAYGTGAIPVARFLSSRHIDYLAVAYADEGVELRKAGITLPILVLNPEQVQWSLLFEHQLEPEVYSLVQCERLARSAEQQRQALGIHIKLDTGMARLGFVPNEIEQLTGLLQSSPWLEVKSIFSHLAAADDADQDDFSHRQCADFLKVAQKLKSVLQGDPALHILNSNGIVRFPQFQGDMVRLGIGIYGIGILGVELEPVHTLSCEISQLKRISAGTSIGYGRSEIATQDMRLATIGIGYADGLIRKAGNRRYSVLVNGQMAPIVGNVCMDMAMIDVTGLDGIAVGSRVIIFGKELPVTALATAADTIPYEVFTNISARVRRVYTQE